MLDVGEIVLAGPEEGIWGWSGKILWSRPVARNLLGVL